MNDIYEKAFNCCVKSFDDLYSKLDIELELADKHVQDLLKKDEDRVTGEQVEALKEFAVSYGKLKMLNDVMCFMLEAITSAMRGGLDNANI